MKKVIAIICIGFSLSCESENIDAENKQEDCDIDRFDLGKGTCFNSTALVFMESELAPLFQLTIKDSVYILNENSRTNGYSEQISLCDTINIDLVKVGYGITYDPYDHRIKYPNASFTLVRYVGLQNSEQKISSISGSTVKIVNNESFPDFFCVDDPTYSFRTTNVAADGQIQMAFKISESTRYTSFWPGRGDDTPPRTHQPFSKFEILRIQDFGGDSVFIEVNFDVRLYSSADSSIDISNGYFKGFIKRNIF